MLTNNQNKNQKKPLVTNFIRNLLPFGVRSQQGSTLPMAIGLGSAMMIVGAVAVMKGGQESTNTTSSEQTKQAMAVAEGGVTKIQSFLANNPSLAMLDLEQWQDIMEDPSNTEETVKNEIKKTAGTQKISLGEEIEKKQNELKSQEKNDDPILCDANSKTNLSSKNEGTPHVLGKNFNSQTIEEGLKSIVGMKLVNSQAKTDWVPLGNNKGEYRLVSYERTADDSAKAIIQGKVGNAKAELVVDLGGSYEVKPYTPESENINSSNSALGESVPALWIMDNNINDFGNNNFNGDILISQTDCDFKGDMPEAQNFVDPKTQGAIKISKLMPPVPTPPITPKNVNAITKNTIFPLNAANDPQDSEGYYHYTVPSIDIKGSTKVTISSGKKVVFHLNGNMTMSGNSGIVTQNDAKLEIYGSSSTTNVLVNGGATASVFIHAPNANAGINGGGNSNPNFAGSIWAKSWKGSSSNSGVFIRSAGVYSDYLGGKDIDMSDTPASTVTTNYSNVGKITNWTRQTISQN
ncbi:MAG: hypothetical protein Kow0091_03230 [Geminocystis sp.]